MRIVHGVSNIAGIPAMLAHAQRERGHQATAVLYETPRGAAPGAVNLTRLIAGNRLSRKVRRAEVLWWWAQRYDIVHLHFHSSLLAQYRDLALFRALGKRVVFHLHGCDIRNPPLVRRTHLVSACAECPVQCMTEVKRDLPGAIRRYADAVIVATPDLLQFVPEARYIPNPVDLTAWQALGRRHDPAEHPTSEMLTVAHAPTDRAIKGTRHLQAAIAQLQREGVPVQLRLLEGLSQPELRQACLSADVVVDQLLIGWFGLFALEMMALGKPVVAYIRPDLARFAPGLPVVSADPATLLDVLRTLLRSPDLRQTLAARGPDYVRVYHNPEIAYDRIMGLYEEIGA